MAGKKDRLTRRILLGASLAAAILWYLAGELGFDNREMLGFLLASVLLVGVCALAAFLFVGILKLIRRH